MLVTGLPASDAERKLTTASMWLAIMNTSPVLSVDILSIRRYDDLPLSAVCQRSSMICMLSLLMIDHNIILIIVEF